MSRIYIKTYALSTSDPGQGVRNFCYRNNFSTSRKADGACCGGLISLLGICFWREGFEAAFGPDRMGEKGGCTARKLLLLGACRS